LRFVWGGVCSCLKSGPRDFLGLTAPEKNMLLVLPFLAGQGGAKGAGIACRGFGAHETCVALAALIVHGSLLIAIA
jgi:hypothetical protein